MISIVSVGYERRTVEELIDILAEHGVSTLLDVREAAISRKRGFSKKALASHLTEAGIEYKHIVEAGNPYRKLKANTEQCLEMYRDHLRAHPEVVDVVAEECSNGLTAFLCYERAHTDCHRSILLDELDQKGYTIRVIKVE